MADPASSPPAPLARYRQKRNFRVTAEPSGAQQAAGPAASPRASFVVQKHWASRLHYDFRLEHAGVLLSWAVPKGPSYDPSKMQMAIHVEDHPLDYATFEGTIPPRQYGAGTVIVWDRGTWEPVGDVDDGMQKGKLVFRLHGEKLAGLWELVRIARPGDKQDAWMLFKKRDEWARPLAEYDVIAALPDSVVAGPRPVEDARAARHAAPATVPRRTRRARTISPRCVGQRLPARLAAAAATLSRRRRRATGSSRRSSRLPADGPRRQGKARLITRGGHDWTDRMKALAGSVEALGPNRPGSTARSSS